MLIDALLQRLEPETAGVERVGVSKPLKHCHKHLPFDHTFDERGRPSHETQSFAIFNILILLDSSCDSVCHAEPIAADRSRAVNGGRLVAVGARVPTVCLRREFSPPKGVVWLVFNAH